MNILSLQNIVKTYDKHVAVNNVSFDMPTGVVFGMLGPNGAGKTSLIRIITTITKADSGVILLNGVPLNSKNANQIGYMPEERGLYKKMKVGEQLLYLAQLKGLSYAEAKKAIDEWLEKFAISEWWNKKIEDLSKGMQQKVQFIATVIHQPKLLILDEPFTGLDPINANLIQDEIDILHKKGTSIIFSTHRMEQVEEICNHIILINKGELILKGDVGLIKNEFKENKFSIDYEGVLPNDLDDKIKVISNQSNNIILKAENTRDSNHILSYLIANGVYIKAFKEVLPTINEIFIRKVEGF